MQLISPVVYLNSGISGVHGAFSNADALQKILAIQAVANMAEERAARSTNPMELACVCSALRRASRSVTLLYDLVLAPTGLRATQFIILRALHDHAEIAQCDLARDHSIAVETLSRRLATLRRKGYVQVRVGCRHGERIYSLTVAGEHALAVALPYWQRAQDRLKAALGGEYQESLFSFCEHISKAAKCAEHIRIANHAAFS